MAVSAREVRTVFDPALAPRTRRWLQRLIARRAHPEDKLAVERACRLAIIACVLGTLVSGLAGPWLFATAASAAVTFLTSYEIVAGGLHRHRDRFVEPSELDGSCREPLHAAQAAIDAVLGSEVHRTGMLDQAARASDLRRHEWEIAGRLREITRLRAEHARSVSEGVPGPQTAAVLRSHLRAITIAQDATARRVGELQCYAGEVIAADNALRDWRTAEQLASRNDVYLDLVARSEADEHAIAEIADLTERAARTRDAFQATLDQAMLAAQPLVFPDQERACEHC